MKPNRKIQVKRHGVATTLSVVLLITLITGVVLGFHKLRELWLEQCVVTNMAEQVSITSGKMVKADVIAEEFGIRTGANLATIDYEELRVRTLKRIPNLRAISISRQLPGHVTIITEERTPVAKMNIRGNRNVTGRVVDSDGVVFDCLPGTAFLPTIRESRAPGTTRGDRLEGLPLAALRLIETCREPEFRDLGVLEIDTSKPDYLLMTLGNYSHVKFSWDGLENPSSGDSRKNMTYKLQRLMNAIRTSLTSSTGATTWDATDNASPCHIYAK